MYMGARCARVRKDMELRSVLPSRKILLVLGTERCHHRMPLPKDESNSFNEVCIEYRMYSFNLLGS
jgi:hypothetical protein